MICDAHLSSPVASKETFKSVLNYVVDWSLQWKIRSLCESQLKAWANVDLLTDMGCYSMPRWHNKARICLTKSLQFSLLKVHIVKWFCRIILGSKEAVFCSNEYYSFFDSLIGNLPYVKSYALIQLRDWFITEKGNYLVSRSLYNEGNSHRRLKYMGHFEF